MYTGATPLANCQLCKENAKCILAYCPYFTVSNIPTDQNHVRVSEEEEDKTSPTNSASSPHTVDPPSPFTLL